MKFPQLGETFAGAAATAVAAARRGSRARAIWTAPLVAVVSFCFALPAAAADYLLNPGDMLELSVIGAFHEPQKATVGIDGLVSFPLVGEVPAAGRTLKDVRADIRNRLTSQPLRRQTSEPGPPTYSITPNDVSVQITEFRPVYVDGDVLHPGQFTYRPGLTVRQAVSIAGGYGRERSEGRLVELQNKLDRASLDYARASLQADSLEAELGKGAAQDDASTLAGVNPSILKAMAAEEEERRTAREQAYESKRTFLKSALDLSHRRIDALQSQVENEQKGADLDAAEVVSVDELFHKGLVQASRLTDVRRSSLLSSSRALQTTVALEDARRDLSETQSKLDGLDHDQRVLLLTDLETANANLRNASIEMEGARRALSLEGDVATGVEIVVFRPGADAAHGAPVDEGAELLPGDTVTVTIVRRENAAAGRKTAEN